ncbi:MAG TPA: hypothetical protein PKM88_14475, partial [bacterium]|nr:hypothetical protein [bacterium]
MRMLIALSLLAALVAGCEAPATPLTPRGNAFTYEPMNTLQSDGLGRWRIEVTDAGMLSLRYSVRDFIEPYAPQALPPAARERLWQQSAACDFPNRRSSTRAGAATEQLIGFNVLL